MLFPYMNGKHRIIIIIIIIYPQPTYPQPRIKIYSLYRSNL